MIAVIINFVGLFIWLLYETDWLRVNLMPVKQTPLHWQSTKQHHIRSLCEAFGLHSYIGVLCGWDWAIEHQDLVPTYNIEFRLDGAKQTITNASPRALAEVMKIYRTKHKPKEQIYPPSHYAWGLAGSVHH